MHSPFESHEKISPGGCEGAAVMFSPVMLLSEHSSGLVIYRERYTMIV